MPDVAALEAFLDSATHTLFRLETLTAYAVASDGGDFARYVNGEPGPDTGRKAAWHAVLQANRERGIRESKVHVLRSPLSQYLRYECEWGYAWNQHLEEIRILDLAEVAEPAGLVDHDFWLIDESYVAVMRYDPVGRYLGFDVGALGQLERYVTARDAAWGSAVPFAEYWNAHPQYWRDHP